MQKREILGPSLFSLAPLSTKINVQATDARIYKVPAPRSRHATSSTSNLIKIVLIAIIVLVLSFQEQLSWLTKESLINSAGGNLRNQPSFHVVYCLILPNDGTVPTMDYAHVDAIIAANTKMVTENRGQSHLLTNDGEAIRTLRKPEGLIVKDFRNDKSSARLDAFRQSYVSQTVNPTEYEALCMWRWIVIADYYQTLVSQGVKVDQILAIDTDVVLTADPRKLLDTKQATPWNKLESMMIVPGAAMMWSLPGLENFVTFLSHAYEDKSTATEFVKRYGAVFPFCREEGSLLIPCTAEKGEMWHISDMYVLNAWFCQNEATRQIRNDKEKDFCLTIGRVGSVPGFQFQKHNSSIVGISAAKEGTVTDVCLVHFQGSSKQMIPEFLSFMAGKQDSFMVEPEEDMRS